MGNRSNSFFSSLHPSPRTRYRVPPAHKTAGVRGIHIVPSGGQGGYAPQSPKKIVLDLSVARSNAVQFISGTIIWVYRVFNQADGSPNTSALIGVQLNDNGDVLNWNSGNGVEGIPYNKVFITNAAQAGISAEIAYLQDTSERPVRFF